MLWYGGSITFNGVIVYVAYNVDKVLLGRYWGADTLGIYGRAYQLINLPTDNLTSTVSQVVFPALARLQNDAERLRSYFVQGYGFFFALVMPLTAGCAIFSNDIVTVFLGPKWTAAAPIFRLLAPTMFTFAFINPLGWMLMATGRVSRSLKMAGVIAPTVIVGYSIGLRYGPQGVALGFSLAMLLLAVPLAIWAIHGTAIRIGDVVKAIAPSFISISVATIVVVALARVTGAVEPIFFRLVVESAILFGVYWGMLLFVLGQRPTYMKILGELRFRGGRSTPPADQPDKIVEEISASA
jgi:PST family polysaccharide transporter